MESTLTFKQKFVAYLKNAPKRYFITAFSGMALGLFCTLIAGTIIALVASWLGENKIGELLTAFATLAKILMGAGIGIGIAYKLNAKPLVIFSAAVTGFIGAFALELVNGTLSAEAFSVIYLKAKPGNPIGSYVLALLTVEVCNLYAGKTKLDIVLIPLGMIVLSMLGVYVAWPFIKLIDLFAELLVILISAGSAIKIITGIVIAIVMGILLTMPTSSAAIWLSIATSNTALANPDVFAIAGGAAVAGCAAHMVGFAVTSYRENGVGGLISQGIGTSMLQIPNIMVKPAIMVPEIVSSAVAGLVAVLLGMRCNAAGGGMGTSGLVGLFGVIEASSGIPTINMVLGILLCLFVIPAFVSLLVSEFMRKKNLIKFGDMKLPD
ncbi:MAG: PTS sugar transporter subunit IIC [Clostridia bacterium]|nr:PTS sugar transporter subunit IIC [Clostridia bacterium]